MKNLLGGKGANLAEMRALGLPVPPGFTITTEVCTHYYANERELSGRAEGEVDGGAGARSRRPSAQASATPNNPLLVSVRSGARASMPGMMDTVLNLGLNDETVEGLAKLVRRRALRLRQLPPLHPDVLATWCWASTTTISRRSSRRTRSDRGVQLDTELTADDWQAVVADYKADGREASSASRSRRIRRSSSGARSARCSPAG